MMVFARRVPAAAALVLLAAGCSSGAGPLTRSGPSVTPSSGTPATSATAPATTPASSASASGKQQATVTPATGLKSTQTVLVQASGFSPGTALVVTECADKGTATGPGDCDLTGMQNITADSGGRVKVQFTVRKGPFGTNNIVCGPSQQCLVSVTQATLNPSQEADTPIRFG